MNGATRTYNAANQLTNDGTNTLTYDANGNLTSDGTNTYTWDRANRLAKVDNGTPADLTAYAYDGLNNRISQSIGTTTPIVTQYLLDTQPGLTKVLAATTGANTERYIHAPQGSNVPGIHAMQNNAGDWLYMAQDGLGSVRSLIDSTLGVDTTQSYNPYGVPDGNYGTGFGFTGEQTDSNGQVYLRARYYDPSIGVFNSLDPFEGTMGRPMSLNGYAYVEGNTPNRVDPSGNLPINTSEINWLTPGSLQKSLSNGVCMNQSDGSDPIPPRPVETPSPSQPKSQATPNPNAENAVEIIRQAADKLYNCLPNSGKECIPGDLSRVSFSPPLDSLAALTILMKWGRVNWPYMELRELMDNITLVLLNRNGPRTILEDAIGPRTNDNHPLINVDANQTGLHIDYQRNTDGTIQNGQLSHFWPYFNTRIQGGERIFRLADIYHECLEGGGTVPDARLTTRAYQLGDELLRWGIGDDYLVHQFNQVLRSPFSGCLLSHYYTVCHDAEDINRLRRIWGGEALAPTLTDEGVASRNHQNDPFGFQTCSIGAPLTYGYADAVDDLIRERKAIQDFIDQAF